MAVNLANGTFKIFINEKFCISIRILLKFGPRGLIDIVSGNGLVPNRRQTITWTNTDPIVWFHNNFSPSGDQPEHCKLAHEL